MFLLKITISIWMPNDWAYTMATIATIAVGCRYLAIWFGPEIVPPLNLALTYFGTFSGKIYQKNKGRGVYIDFQWVCTYQVNTQ